MSYHLSDFDDVNMFPLFSLTLFKPEGSLGTPQRFLSITLTAFGVIL